MQFFHPLKTLSYCPTKYSATILVDAQRIFEKKRTQQHKSIYYKKSDVPKSVK